MEQLHGDDEPLVRGLHWVIRMAVRVLAILMTGVIAFGVADVVYVLYKRLMAEPAWFLEISDILATFGAFMAVLIAIEIFVNIVSYLREDVIHVRIVLATALMAIARKVIILDYSTTSPQYIYATAAVVAAMALAYWLIVRYRPGAVRKSTDRRLTDQAHSRRCGNGPAAARGSSLGLIVVPEPLADVLAVARLPEVLHHQRHHGDEVELAEHGLEHGRHAPDAPGRREVAVATVVMVMKLKYR